MTRLAITTLSTKNRWWLNVLPKFAVSTSAQYTEQVKRVNYGETKV